MSQWNNLIEIIEYYVLNTTLGIYEIIEQIKLNENLVVGMIVMYDALNALRIKYTGIEPTTQRINLLISNRKMNRENRHSIDAYDSITK